MDLVYGTAAPIECITFASATPRLKTFRRRLSQNGAIFRKLESELTYAPLEIYTSSPLYSPRVIAQY